MSSDSLPLYRDEKEPLVEDMQEDDKQFDGLRVGQPTYISRVRERWTSMGKVKKGLIAALAFFALVHFVSGFKGHGGRRGHWRGEETVWGVEDEEWTPSDATWEPTSVSSVDCAWYMTNCRWTTSLTVLSKERP